MTTRDRTLSRDGAPAPIGLTQAEIAEILGISRARVSFIERQAMKKLHALAVARGIDLAALTDPDSAPVLR